MHTSMIIKRTMPAVIFQNTSMRAATAQIANKPNENKRTKSINAKNSIATPQGQKFAPKKTPQALSCGEQSRSIEFTEQTHQALACERSRSNSRTALIVEQLFSISACWHTSEFAPLAPFGHDRTKERRDWLVCIL